MAQEYYIGGPNGNRTTTDPGSATVVSGFGGSDKKPTDWGDMAYTAGGGMLGYMLSKWLMGDGDEEGGKKKSKGVLKSIIPWLAAAAGAYGGHLLSGSGLKEKGQIGEFAFKKNEDGTVRVPSKPWSGKNLHRTGNVLGATGAATMAKGVAEIVKNRPASLMARGATINKPSLIRKASKILSSRADMELRHPHLTGLGSFIGKPFGKSNVRSTALVPARSVINVGKGTLYSGLAQLIASAIAHGVGSRMNKNVRNFSDALKSIGVDPKEVGK